ncbi:MAG: PEP-CTERM sorting domain-containing protein [Proteobacteria bacterium]|nr:PEP-CTERM sorting domain-containing protein [Pseudomonadota bacterium]
MFNINMPATSTITAGGVTYYANQGHQQMLEVFSNSINLWSYWGSAACPSCAQQGDQVFGLSGSYSHTPAGGSSGGTAVPEPGMLGLMGLGAAAMAFRRRRGIVPTLMPRVAFA